jgi:hypothetical protein
MKVKAVVTQSKVGPSSLELYYDIIDDSGNVLKSDVLAVCKDCTEEQAKERLKQELNNFVLDTKNENAEELSGLLVGVEVE